MARRSRKMSRRPKAEAVGLDAADAEAAQRRARLESDLKGCGHAARDCRGRPDHGHDVFRVRREHAAKRATDGGERHEGDETDGAEAAGDGAAEGHEPDAVEQEMRPTAVEQRVGEDRPRLGVALHDDGARQRNALDEFGRLRPGGKPVGERLQRIRAEQQGEAARNERELPEQRLFAQNPDFLSAWIANITAKTPRTTPGTLNIGSDLRLTPRLSGNSQNDPICRKVRFVRTD